MPAGCPGYPFLAGVLITLQYLLFNALRIVLGIRWMFKRIGVVFIQIFSRSNEAEPAEKEKDNDSQKLTTDIDKIVGDEEKGNRKQA